MERGK